MLLTIRLRRAGWARPLSEPLSNSGSSPNVTPESANVRRSGDSSRGNTSRCFTGSSLQRELWKSCVAGTGGGKPTPESSRSLGLCCSAPLVGTDSTPSLIEVGRVCPHRAVRANPETTDRHRWTLQETGIRNQKSGIRHRTKQPRNTRKSSRRLGCRASVWSARGLTAAFSARQPSTAGTAVPQVVTTGSTR